MSEEVRQEVSVGIIFGLLFPKNAFLNVVAIGLYRTFLPILVDGKDIESACSNYDTILEEVILLFSTSHPKYSPNI